MNDNRLYFEITGPLLPIIAAYKAELEDVRRRANRFLKRFGTQRFLGSEAPLSVSGIYWPPKKTDLPDGWRRSRDDADYIVPDKRIKAGKWAARELAKLSQPEAKALFDECKVPAFCVIGRAFIRPTVGRIAGRYLLIIGASPEGKKVKHKGLKPLKAWEFHKLFEEQGPLLSVG